jgi:hypothetical protein
MLRGSSNRRAAGAGGGAFERVAREKGDERKGASPAAPGIVLRSRKGDTIVNIGADDRSPLETGDGDPRDQIARLESRVEELADAMERCRKIRLISRIAIAVSDVWMRR